MNKAPGLKIIIIIFLIFVLSIFLYFIWYLKVDKLTIQKLESIQNSLKQQNINFEWDEYKKSGFPYRIETNLKNININYNNTSLSTKSLKIIYQPWNKHHILIKFPNDLNIFYNNKNIRITNANILASLVIDKNFNKRISITSDKINIFLNKKTYYITKPELYFKIDNFENIQYVILMDKLIWAPLFVKNDVLSKLYINGKIVKYNNFNINHYLKWFTNEGGISFDKITININTTNLNGNGFISVDKNLDIQSSMSLSSNNINYFIKILEKNNFISKNILITSKFIVKATETSSKLYNKKPIFSITIQNGFLYLMGIKLLTIPNLKKYL